MPIQLPAQGLADFESLDDYLAAWVQPGILGDLRTLVKATEHWEQWNKEGGRAFGAAKYPLFSCLIMVTEHLGQILRGNPRSVLGETEENIRFFLSQARPPFARGTYNRVSRILAVYGRHALVHSSWPETMVWVDPFWFGLGIATSRRDRHLTGEWQQATDHQRGQSIEICRFFINAYQFFEELDDFCHEGLNPSDYNAMFLRVRDAEMRRRDFGTWASERRKTKENRHAKLDDLKRQILIVAQSTKKAVAPES